MERTLLNPLAILEAKAALAFPVHPKLPKEQDSRREHIFLQDPAAFLKERRVLLPTQAGSIRIMPRREFIFQNEAPCSPLRCLSAVSVLPDVRGRSTVDSGLKETVRAVGCLRSTDRYRRE